MLKLSLMSLMGILTAGLLAAAPAQVKTPTSSAANAKAASASKSLVAKGPDYFVIGVWQQPPQLFKTWSQRGINTLVTNAPKPDHKPDRPGYFKLAAANNLAVVIGADPENPLNDKQYPNFLAWLQRDEPENWPALKKTKDGKYDVGGSIEQYQSNYGRLKKLSPMTPIWGNFNGMHMTGTTKKAHDRNPVGQEHYPPFMLGTDWVSADWYVRPAGRDGNRIGDLIGTMCRRLEEWSGGKPFFVFVDCAELGIKGTPAPPAAPKPEEMRAVAWIGVINGARGIVYFPLKIAGGFAWDNTPPVLLEEMTSLNHNLMEAAPFILNGKRISSSTPEKHTATWTLKGQTLTATVEWKDEKWVTTIVKPKK